MKKEANRKETVYDVIVVGAGAAGLMAALELALTGRRVAIVEAKERAGGRMHTILDGWLPVELGAEFVHGNLPVTKGLLDKANADITRVQGSFWQHADGRLHEQEEQLDDEKTVEKKCRGLEADKTVSQFLAEDLGDEKYKELRHSLQNYVEGYYAADTDRSSTKALCEELQKADEEQYRIKGGYRLLVQYLEEQCREKGVQFYFSQTVTDLHWKRGEAIVVTETSRYLCTKVLITVSLGVLQAEAIQFQPALPAVNVAVQQLGFGHVIKIILQFEDSFWKDKKLTDGKDLHDLNFLFSEEEIPTWWTHYPMEDATLVGWLGGPKAEALKNLNEEKRIAKAISSLSRIFNLDVTHLHQKLVKAHAYNWSADPHYLGAYSYEVVKGEAAIERLKQPIEETVFFAGEALHGGPITGTVEAALVSGRDTAHRMVAINAS